MKASDVKAILSAYPNLGMDFLKVVNLNADTQSPTHIFTKDDEEVSGVYECKDGFNSLYETNKASGGRYAVRSDFDAIGHFGMQGACEKLANTPIYRTATVSDAIGGYPECSEVRNPDTGATYISTHGDNESEIVVEDSPMETSHWKPRNNRVTHVAIETGEMPNTNNFVYPMENPTTVGSDLNSNGYDGSYLFCTFTPTFDFFGGVHPQTVCGMSTSALSCASFRVVPSSYTGIGGMNLSVFGLRRGNSTLVPGTSTLGYVSSTLIGGMFFKANVTYQVYVDLHNAFVVEDGHRMGDYITFSTTALSSSRLPYPNCEDIAPIRAMFYDTTYTPTSPQTYKGYNLKLTNNSKLLYWRYILGVPGQICKTGAISGSINPNNPKFPHWNSYETT